MYLKQHKPIHSQRGPSCLAVILFAGLLFVAGYLFANRENVPAALDPLLPDPTAIPTESPANYALRGRLFERDGETEQAIGAWESAIAADPENPTYYEQLAKLQVEVGRPEEALDLLDTALDFAREDDGLLQAKAGAHIAYGEWLVDHGESGLQQFILAVSVGSNAVKINPNNAKAYAYMAGGYVRQSNTEWIYALEPAATAYDIAPEDPIVLYHTAEAVRFNGNATLAVERLEKANELDPDNAKIALELAGVYRLQEIGRGGESIPILENVLESNQCNAAILDRLAFYYIIAGTLADMRPILGTPDDVAALWAHINDTIDCIATDHAPHTLAEKRSDSPPPGVVGLETSLPLMLTAVRDNKLTLDRLIAMMHTHPRTIFTLPDQPDTAVEVELGDFTIQNADLKTKVGWTPFDGRKVAGRVVRVVLRGETVFENGEVLARPGSGNIIF